MKHFFDEMDQVNWNIISAPFREIPFPSFDLGEIYEPVLYPSTIKHSNGTYPINGGFNEKINYKWDKFHCQYIYIYIFFIISIIIIIIIFF